MSDQQPAKTSLRLLATIGPAIIVASVVLGPGSILASSRVGYEYGYDLIWVLVSAVVLLVTMTALSARLGVHLEGTICDELASRAGRPLAFLAGGTLFLVAACFQFSNNLGVLYAVEPLVGQSADGTATIWPIVLLVLINGAIVTALFGFRHLYIPVERLMKFLVAVMVVGFAANLVMAKPSLLSILLGLVPQLPDQATDTLLPRVTSGGEGNPKPQLQDNLWAVQALIATTFSVGGAFYQSYLVRQKGWGPSDLKRGLVDSVTGIATLGVISLMIMVTAASVLHGNQQVQEIGSVADVARQLEPLFGPWAMGLFCMGLFAGAFSSFLVNAMIGGTALSDGLGQGGSMDGLGPRLGTALALAIGMAVALGVKAADMNIGNLIIFAQALTVLGNPLLAGVMLWLATRSDMVGERQIPLWMKTLASVGFVVVLVLSIRTAVRLYLQMTAM